MVSIMTITPTIVTTEVISCVRLCCSVLLMLSMSLVDAAQDLAVGARVEELQRQTRELLVHLAGAGRRRCAARRPP